MKDKTYKKVIRILSIFAGIAVLISIPAWIYDEDLFILISLLLYGIVFAILFSFLFTRIEVTDKIVKKMWLASLLLILLIIPGAIFYILPLVMTPLVTILFFLILLILDLSKKLISCPKIGYPVKFVDLLMVILFL